MNVDRVSVSGRLQSQLEINIVQNTFALMLLTKQIKPLLNYISNVILKCNLMLYLFSI